MSKCASIAAKSIPLDLQFISFTEKLVIAASIVKKMGVV